MRPDQTEKDKIISIPEISGLDRFHHYFATSPHLFPPPPAGGGKEGGGNKVVRVRQIHGDDILVIDQDIRNLDLFINSRIFDNGYDALITNQEGITLEIRTADCLPVLIIDPNKMVVAAIHAGWKGSFLNLTEKVVNRMNGLFGSSEKDLFVGFGPSIGPCCYEVGHDLIGPVRKRYPDWKDLIEESGDGKGMFNIEGFNKRQLLALGIRNDRIFSINLCTSCNPHLFPSYRRDGKVTKNIYSGIMIRE